LTQNRQGWGHLGVCVGHRSSHLSAHHMWGMMPMPAGHPGKIPRFRPTGNRLEIVGSGGANLVFAIADLMDRVTQLRDEIRTTPLVITIR